ncbi:tRNA-splicing endonuclease subunit Sen2 isoform X2 [Puntigrus tetrazona]|uniref:tRNA-splicing endonuclease subunit Sen2 isoform X2 n=1 Tax=Puntigrus tetrazona TaxID=1606681 RepID=UPI001C8A91CF|nr:tRNA-splicing endonuclease subunit Sen2 isoform X2 [Puntigrus tetrazona]
MTEAVFQAPKRRTKVHERFEAPLPVSLDEGHVVFRAEILAHHVIVTDPAHILLLYQRGFFGKGVFSRSRPEHVISPRWKYAGDRCVPVISSKEYQKRLGWARAALQTQGLEDESVARALETLAKPVELSSEGRAPEQSGAGSDPGEEEVRTPEEDASHYVLVELSEDEERSRSELRINPFTLMEYLQLSYEEEALSVTQVWTMFRSLQPNFSSSYAAYHYFRSKGWVPKSGIKYGTDLMLYRKGPPFYHASYSVVVDRCDESLRPFSWKSLAALCRITGNVSKELMLCSVLTPSDVTEDLLSSPECLKRFSVQEVIVSRWVSSRERTEQEEI